MLPLPPNLMGLDAELLLVEEDVPGNSAQIRPSVMPSAAMTKSLRRSALLSARRGNWTFGGSGHSVRGKSPSSNESRLTSAGSAVLAGDVLRG
ncbi:hypothetical protein ACVOMV_00060 [Mesorhizobium atlanticum]